MLLTHSQHSPRIHPKAYVAPNALVCGNVTVGPGCRILFGAQVVAEGGSITLGNECIVMENAVLRSSQRHSLTIGNNCLIGPNAHVVGCTIEDEVFVATGATVFHSARLGKKCEVRVNGVVHVRSELAAGATVPIGWVAVGSPAQILPPGEHEKIWEIQKPLNFPLTVYGLERSQANMVEITRRLSKALASHAADEPT
jgi:carbonic anhydrase/acetyltransferase-like protein (isoleucine patch superfamily)